MPDSVGDWMEGLERQASGMAEQRATRPLAEYDLLYNGEWLFCRRETVLGGVPP